MPVEVDVLARAESVAMLRDRVAGLSAEDADLLADALGDLPLAIAQAAGYMADTGMPAGGVSWACWGPGPSSYWTRGGPTSYPRSLAAVTGLSAGPARVARTRPPPSWPSVCAFLAPEPVPADLVHRRRRGAARRAGCPGGRPAGLAADAWPR